jgi:hypothetical protein
VQREKESGEEKGNQGRRMVLKIKLLWLAAIAALVLIRPASANELLGDWHNINPETRGLVRVVIDEMGGAVRVHAWGVCHPMPCDWGTVRAIPYAPDVDTPLPMGAKYLLAEFTTTFSRTLLIIRTSAESPGQLEVTYLGQFTDGRGRSNHADTELLVK